MFTYPQQLKQAQIHLNHLTEAQFFEIVHHKQTSLLTTAQLLEILTIANRLYRSGAALMSDADYDFVFMAALKQREPTHPWFNQVEPTPLANPTKTVVLPEKMLSTDKAYTWKAIERWLKRIEKSALGLNKTLTSLRFRVTPKLDGYAAYDDGQKLYTRGDGYKGTDITQVFDRGLQIAQAGQRGLGAGEIVISKTYFAQHLAAQFDNSRNFQASIIKEKQLSVDAEKAIKAKAAVFFPFAILPDWTGSAQSLQDRFDTIIKTMWDQTDYDVDGVVLEVSDTAVKADMGATRHHHRWQIAYKENLTTAQVIVRSVTPQTSRSGRITPVAELEPIRLSGALLQRATAHHYKMVINKGIGAGAVVKIARSGEVIPKIEKVLTAVVAQVPTHCPSCDHQLIWEGDFLICTQHLTCAAQLTHTMTYFFKTLGNNEGFGHATIAKFYAQGIHCVSDIYPLTVDQLKAFGFGAKQSINLVTQLTRSRTEMIEDWRFLAAFGLFRLGAGHCEKLLTHYSLESLFTLTEEAIINIEGFAEKTAKIVIQGLTEIKPVFDVILALGFNLHRTMAINRKLLLLDNKRLVFTGTMQQGSRNQMNKQAQLLGATVSNAVSEKTDWLIIGDKVGAVKINAAREKGVTIITEQDYLQRLATSA
jgi:DNA ligase (NAD+)